MVSSRIINIFIFAVSCNFLLFYCASFVQAFESDDYKEEWKEEFKDYKDELKDDLKEHTDVDPDELDVGSLFDSLIGKKTNPHADHYRFIIRRHHARYMRLLHHGLHPCEKFHNYESRPVHVLNHEHAVRHEDKEGHVEDPTM